MKIEESELFRERRPAMGTTGEVLVAASDPREARQIFDLAFAEIERVESDLSDYRPSSEISRINHGAASSPVTIDPEMLLLLQNCLEMSRISDGAFDITIGPLVEVWGFFGGQGSLPSKVALERAREKVGWQHVELDPDARTVFFRRRGVRIDLGAVGKGVALDAARRTLLDAGVRKPTLLSLGRSTFRALGAQARGFPIEVLSPLQADSILSEVTLIDRALSTSGDREKFFELEGRRYGHILDARSGWPVEGRTQVSVLAADATLADLLSTALFVLGPEAGEVVLEENRSGETRPGALFVSANTADRAFHTLHWPSPVRQTAL